MIKNPSSISKIPAGLPGGSSSSVGQDLLANRHILEVKMFNKDVLYAIFNLAETFRSCVAMEQSIDHILKGKVSWRKIKK